MPEGGADSSERLASSRVGSPEARYQHLVENVQDAVVEFEFVDEEPIVRRVNEAFERTFGYSEAAICGGSLNDWIVPEQGEACGIDTQTQGGQATSRQLTRQTATGTREFLHRSIPYGETGDIDGVAIYTEITERELASQKRQLIAETSRCVAEAKTLEEGLKAFIRTVCEQTDWVYGEAWQPGKGGDDLLYITGYADDATHEPFIQASRQVTFEHGRGLPGRVYESEATEWMDDVVDTPATLFHRTEIAARVGLHAAFGVPVVTDGEVVAILVFFLDEPRHHDAVITEHIVDVAGHLGGLVARKKSEQKIREQNERLQKFTDILSHDLRNPLTVIIGRIDYLDTGDEKQEHVEAIRNSALRMEEMVDNLLALSRSGADGISCQPVSLRAVAADSREMVPADGATFEIEIPDTAVVRADPDCLMNVFENLFRNAWEHNEPPISVRVGIVEDAKMADSEESIAGFFIEDDGAGIPACEQEDVFQYGYTTNTNGTGFGLPIVRELVEAHGWEISVSQPAGGGTRFTVHMTATSIDPCMTATRDSL